MKKTIRKIVSTLMAATLAASFLTACGDGNTATARQPARKQEIKRC